jgi:DNA-binding CsgD family transcriptional regulator
VPARVGPIDRRPQVVDAGARPHDQHGVGAGRVQSAQRAVVTRVDPGADREHGDRHRHRDEQHRPRLGRTAQQLADGGERREPSRFARPPRELTGEERQHPQRHDGCGDGQQRRGQHRQRVRLPGVQDATGLELNQPVPAPVARRAGDLGTIALSRREREVAQLVAAGNSNPEIGRALFLSPKTIEGHMSRIFAKLGVSSRAQVAAAIAADEDHA